MKSFSDFHLHAVLADSLAQLEFTTPTPIQAQAIPPALKGSDILGSAQTGTGKTAAFMLPVLERLMIEPTAEALIMAPTRELASQVADMSRKLMGRNSGIRMAVLIGGEPMPKQFKQLNNRPRLIIGTPGRIDDHCRRNKFLLDNINMLVLDEADRMLDMGFSVQIDSILKYMPKDRQTLMFSATFADNIISFAKRYLKNPIRVAVKAEKITADKIDHKVIKMQGNEKYDQLMRELDERKGSVIVFVKTRRGADKLAKMLSQSKLGDYRAEPIHGDLRQRQRDRTIKGFRDSKFRILVATDVASRGLDIPHIEHVINYDLPQNPEDYVHRIGRTARAGAEGHAVCFVIPQDGRNWHAIQRLVFPDQVSNNNDRPFNKKKSGKPSHNKKRRRPENKNGRWKKTEHKKFNKSEGANTAPSEMTDKKPHKHKAKPGANVAQKPSEYKGKKSFSINKSGAKSKNFKAGAKKKPFGSNHKNGGKSFQHKKGTKGGNQPLRRRVK